jgi:hypothetical protein
VAGTRYVEHVQIEFHDDPVEMHVDEVLSRGRTPMADHERLHVGERERTLQQGVVV